MVEKQTIVFSFLSGNNNLKLLASCLRIRRRRSPVRLSFPFCYIKNFVSKKNTKKKKKQHQIISDIITN